MDKTFSRRKEIVLQLERLSHLEELIDSHNNVSYAQLQIELLRNGGVIYGHAEFEETFKGDVSGFKLELYQLINKHIKKQISFLTEWLGDLNNGKQG